MISTMEKEREKILQVVRGERPWTDLDEIGIRVQIQDDRCTFQNPRGIEVAADVHDLAKGFLAYRHDPRKLREWAFVIEASDVDLDVEKHPQGEILLNALWSASFG